MRPQSRSIRWVAATPDEQPDIDIMMRILGSVRKGERVALTGPSASHVGLPGSVLTVLQDAGRLLAANKEVVVLSIDHELTSNQVGDVLGISRPVVIKLLEAGRIPYRRVGRHRRVSLRDVLAYKDASDREPQERDE